MGLPLRVKAATLVPLVLLVLLAGGAAAQRGGAPVPGLPPVSMTCPMHPDVVEPKPGSCPQCKMALVPVRLETAWMCPVHTTAMSDRDGTCPICRRQRIQARVAVTYTCDGQPGIDRLDPGRCPDGSPTIARRTLRPHGNHNPQHGGQFFMAPDNWHHLEGIYPRERVFRLYLYDDYARSLSPAAMKRVQARVVTRETFDPATRRTTEIAAFPLRVSANGAYLEAPPPKTIKVDDEDIYESESDYRARMLADDIDQMIPQYETSHGETGDLVAAPEVYVEGDAYALDMTTVALLNVRDSAEGPLNTASVIGTGGQVYASAGALYIYGGTGARTETCSTSCRKETSVSSRRCRSSTPIAA